MQGIDRSISDKQTLLDILMAFGMESIMDGEEDGESLW